MVAGKCKDILFPICTTTNVSEGFIYYLQINTLVKDK